MNRRLILFSLALSGCSIALASTCSVPIKNTEFCRDKGKYGAVCAYWLNAKQTKKNVPLSEWNQKRVGMVCASEAGYGNVRATIERLCQTQTCVEQVDELIKALR